MTSATLAYTAYGTALNFDPAASAALYFFGGDAVYDPISGLYMHGDGTRGSDGFRFIQADTQGNGSNSDPISLHKYLYAGADPVMYADPSGHDLTELLVDIGIDSTINSISLSAIKPAVNILASAFGSALIPSNITNAILNVAPDAITIGAGGAFNFPLPANIPGGIGGVGGRVPMVSQDKRRRSLRLWWWCYCFWQLTSVAGAFW